MNNYSKTINNYEDFETISVVKKGTYTTSLIQDPFSGARYVKKELSKEKLPIYQKLQELKHQGLAEVIEVHEKADKIIVIIEYAVGETLKSILDNKIKLDEKVAKSYIQQLASILNVIHQNGIIHRDINPSNIVVTTNGQVKLIDFDIARFYKYSQTEDTQLLGTPGYAAPEQFGFNQTTASSDIYALGVLLNVMLTGMKPNEMQINNEGLAAIVQNCTAMDQADRYQDVMQLDYDLRRLRQGHPASDNFPKKSNKKMTTPVKVSIILGLLFVASVGYIIFQTLQTPAALTTQLQDIDETQFNSYEQEDTPATITPDERQETTAASERQEIATISIENRADNEIDENSEHTSTYLPPIILENGYGLSRSGMSDGWFLHYGLILENPNEYFAIDRLEIRVTARCANDTILGTRDFLLPGRLHPDQILAAGDQAFYLDERPTTVDFEVLTPQERHFVNATTIDSHIPLTVENTSFVEGGIIPRFTGEVVNENNYIIDRARVTIIFRDENNQIVGGSSTSITHLSANNTHPFDLSVTSSEITTDSFEAHAHAR